MYTEVSRVGKLIKNPNYPVVVEIGPNRKQF